MRTQTHFPCYHNSKMGNRTERQGGEKEREQKTNDCWQTCKCVFVCVAAYLITRQEVEVGQFCKILDKFDGPSNERSHRLLIALP